MQTLKTSEAAALLNVSPNTLRSWERRFGFPNPRRSPGHHRLYAYGDIAALRDALLSGLSISSAIGRAREGLQSGTSPLVGRLAEFDAARADQVMESNLALRSIERAIEQVLLPAVDEIAQRHGRDGAPTAFATRWAGDWLRRASRLTYTPIQDVSLVIGDASRDEFDVDAVWIRALELLCFRSGPIPLCLPVRGIASIADAVAAYKPAAIVIAGNHADDHQVARWAYGVRQNAGSLPIGLYRRTVSSERARFSARRVLPDSPIMAQVAISQMVAAPALQTEEQAVTSAESAQNVRMAGAG